MHSGHCRSEKVARLYIYLFPSVFHFTPQGGASIPSLLPRESAPSVSYKLGMLHVEAFPIRSGTKRQSP